MDFGTFQEKLLELLDFGFNIDHIRKVLFENISVRNCEDLLQYLIRGIFQNLINESSIFKILYPSNDYN